MRPGDFVILKDVIGCVQCMSPLMLLCTDGEVRELTGTPTLIASGQQYALLVAEKAMRKIHQ